RYTDEGANGQPPLTSSDTIILQPKRKEAEHFDASSGGLAQSGANDVESGTPALAQLGDGDWSAYGPVNFTGIDSVTFRVAAGGAARAAAGAAGRRPAGARRARAAPPPRAAPGGPGAGRPAAAPRAAAPPAPAPPRAAAPPARGGAGVDGGGRGLALAEGR